MSGSQPLWHRPFTAVFGRKARLHRAKVAIATNLSKIPGRTGDHGAAMLRRVENRGPLKKASVDRFKARLEALTAQSVCIDAGANLGIYTLMMAETGASVHAYEPDPWTFAKLKESCRDLPNVILHNKAIGATRGTVPITRPVNWEEDPETASHSVRIVNPEGSVEPASAEADFVAEIVAFEDVLAETGPVDIIKMDIEGAELPILEAIEADPARFPVAAMFVETHENIFPKHALPIGRLSRRFARQDRPMVDLDWP